MGQERRRVSHNEMKVCVCSMLLLICRSESGSHTLALSTEMTRTPARRSNSVGVVLYSELRTIWIVNEMAETNGRFFTKTNGEPKSVFYSSPTEYNRYLNNLKSLLKNAAE